MAQALSEEEFQRMQAQLLELRTNNYQLSDELRKNGVELTSLRQKVAYLDKEFNKAQKVVPSTTHPPMLPCSHLNHSSVQ
uniref:GRIP1 associated protein 1 n=1 Tax=Molossus molossus TaxID=27622 RepID=A0A7J8J5M1_MOLMO|nr:GRIP1 associated protein 1 [Molossus molossus]